MQENPRGRSPDCPEIVRNPKRPGVLHPRKAKPAEPGPHLRNKCTQRQRKDVIDAYDLVSLFKLQCLDAQGDAYFKSGVLPRPKKLYAELRGSTMVLFRNADIASSAGLQMRDIVGVLVMKHFHVELEQRQGHSLRIYITGTGFDQTQYLYIKTLHEKDRVRWVESLTNAKSISLPALASLSFESIIGQGGGGKVFLVRHRDLSEMYALKVIEKETVFSSSTAFRHAVSERSLMYFVGSHPFVLRMKFAFQSETNLFIGTPFCGGGDLATYLKLQRKNGSKSPEVSEDAEDPKHPHSSQKPKRYGGHLSEDRALLILAELVLALDHLHERGIVYRDLKPENVLIAEDGHLRLADFGLSKHLKPARFGNGFERTSSVCGTRNYLPPEMLAGKPYGCEADMWSLGILAFRLFCGRFPFEASKTKEVFSKIRKEHLKIPSHVSPRGASLLRGLLCRDQVRRLTAKDVKSNMFFHNVNWDDVLGKRYGPAVQDVDIGSSTSEVLDNFEVSKLVGVSLGERIPSASDESPSEETFYGRIDPAGKIIGFEYASAEEFSVDAKPLELREPFGLRESLRLLSSGGSEERTFSRRKSDLGDVLRAALGPISYSTQSWTSKNHRVSLESKENIGGENELLSPIMSDK